LSDKELDIEAQLDRMLDEATESAAESAAIGDSAADDGTELVGDMETVEQVVASVDHEDPFEPADQAAKPPAAAAKSPLADGDLADQIQKMLNEASEQAGGSSAADIAAEKADELPADDRSPEQMIAQIDDQLADEADDEIVGDFESIEDVAGAQAEAGTEPVGADARDARPHGDDDHLAGDMRSVDEAIGEMVDAPAPAPAPGASAHVKDADDDAEASREADAAAVAAELEADEALHRRPRPAADTDEEAVDQPNGAGDHDQALDRAASAARPERAADKPARRAGPGALIRLMAKVNRPLQSAPRAVRDFVGFFGLTLLFWAACLFAAAFGGFMTAVITGAVALPGLLAVFYLLFIRQAHDDQNAAI
jgi:hypothetical protein